MERNNITKYKDITIISWEQISYTESYELKHNSYIINKKLS